MEKSRGIELNKKEKQVERRTDEDVIKEANKENNRITRGNRGTDIQ